MKILVYGINFAPELTGIGKYSGEMVAWLVTQGHDVRVITAPPYYPDWKVWSSFSAFKYTRQSVDGATVFRVPLWVPKKPSGLKRILHLLSFCFFSIPAVAAQWRWRPDVIFVVEPPLFCAPGAVLFGRIWGAKLWLHIQDFEVDAAFDLGLLKGKVLRRAVLAFERWLMSRFDRVSSISQNMVARLVQKGVSRDMTVHFPNWVDVSFISPIAADGRFREKLGIDSTKLVALYSGNMGAKQGLELLAEVAGILRERADLVFLFCGNGAGRENLERLCAELPNVHFMDLQPLEFLNELLNTADIHLLPQRSDAADLVMPSKLTGMLASGRPVIATAHKGTELADVMEKCGIVVPPGCAEELADGIGILCDDVALRLELGARGRQFAVATLSKDAVLGKFSSDLSACAFEVD